MTKEEFSYCYDRLIEIELTLEGDMEELETSTPNDLVSLQLETLQQALLYVGAAIRKIAHLEGLYES